MYGHSFSPGIGPYPPRVVLASAGSYGFLKRPAASGLDSDIGFGKKNAVFLNGNICGLYGFGIASRLSSTLNAAAAAAAVLRCGAAWL